MPPISALFRSSANSSEARAVTARSVRDSVLKTVGAAGLTVTLLFALAGPAQATDGTFNRAIGFGVNPTGSGGSFEVCTVAANCTVGTNGSAGGQFNDPRDVATDAVGDVYVSDFLNGRVQKFDSSDNLLAVIGS